MSGNQFIIICGSALLPEEAPGAGKYFRADQRGSLFHCDKTETELIEMRIQNNPQEFPVGDHTGRCAYCGSDDLWDDNLAYGCNCCDVFLGGN